MSTQSLTVFLDEEEKEICVVYVHYDGYPAGHGKDLAEMLSASTSVSDPNKLAAEMIAEFAKVAYVYPAGTRGIGEDYIYNVLIEEGVPYLNVVEAHRGGSFELPASEFDGRMIEAMFKG